jgi:hypothetical protein
MNELFFLALLFKHAIADLALQNQLTGINKLDYWGNGHKHYIHHGLLTFLTSLLFVDIYLAIVIGIVDYVAHWNIDFYKHQVCRLFKVKSKGTAWWWITSIDQILHYSTYFFLVSYFAI